MVLSFCCLNGAFYAVLLNFFFHHLLDFIPLDFLSIKLLIFPCNISSDKQRINKECIVISYSCTEPCKNFYTSNIKEKATKRNSPSCFFSRHFCYFLNLKCLFLSNFQFLFLSCFFFTIRFWQLFKAYVLRLYTLPLQALSPYSFRSFNNTGNSPWWFPAVSDGPCQSYIRRSRSRGADAQTPAGYPPSPETCTFY